MQGPYPPPGYVAGVTAPQYGMPMCGTPIGLAGPPHIPLGVPAGLQRTRSSTIRTFVCRSRHARADRREAGAGHPLSRAGQPRPHRGTHFGTVAKPAAAHCPTDGTTGAAGPCVTAPSEVAPGPTEAAPMK